LGLGVAIIVGAVLVSASGAATETGLRVTTINVSTRASVVAYLRSIHVNPKNAVIQRGHLNYAGAHCPGTHWTCASTRHTVVQVAKPDGQNRFVCRRSHCAVVQLSGIEHGVYFSTRQGASTAASGPKPPPQPGNTGYCVKTTGLTQSCTISQGDNNGPNLAGIYQNTMKASGLTQTALYTASITQQSSGTFGNTACVSQIVNIDGSTTALKGKPVTVNLNAHQSVLIQQDAVGSGANTANQAAQGDGHCASGAVAPATAPGLLQSQILTSTANGTATITQNENRNDPAVPDTTNFPCPNVPNQFAPANLCIDIEQNQGAANLTGSGSNGAAFWQENDLTALGNTAAGGTINQTQGAAALGVGGLWGNVNQQSTGTSTFASNQNEVQCEDALSRAAIPIPNTTVSCDTGGDTDPPAGVTVNQAQFGPAGMGSPTKSGSGPVHYYHGGKDPGTSSQTGGTGNNSYQINQNTTQNNDNNTVQKNFLIGGLTSSGNGAVTQNALIQNNTKENVQAGTGSVAGQIICSGSTSASCHKTLSAPVISAQPNDPIPQGADSTFNYSNVDPTVDFVCTLKDVTTNTTTPETCPSTQGTNTSGSVTFSNLPTGQYTFSIKTEDPSNNDLGPASTVTWTIVDANISVTPQTNADEVGGSHTFTVTVLKDLGHGNDMTTPAAGETVTTKIVDSNGATSSMTGGTCGNTSGTTGTGTTDSNGQCTIVVNGPAAGTVKAFASVGVHFTGTPNNLTINRDSDSMTATPTHGPGGTDEATETWVDAYITLTPAAPSQTAGTSQPMTATVYVNDGSSNAYVLTGGVPITFSKSDSGGATSVFLPGGVNTCTTSSVNDSTLGTCAVTVNSGNTGQTKVNASFTNLNVDGVLLSRATGDTISSDSPDAVITWN
jgi:hypothetical protein